MNNHVFQPNEPSTPAPLLGARIWWAVIVRTFWRIQSHRTGLVAAGCAFYATLALFPALSMLVSIYGLLFDPASVSGQMELLEGLLPPDAYTLIERQVQTLVGRPRATLGWSLGLSAAIALWSAATGTKSMIAALNLAYDEEDRRSILGFQILSIGMTAASILSAILTVAVLVALPRVIDLLNLPSNTAELVHWLGILLMILFVFALLTFLYAAGPSRAPRAARPAGYRRRVLPGVILATILWLVSSILFTLYATELASFDAVYGPLAAVAAIMLWFWVSAYVVLLGAELNSALEKAGRPDTPLMDI